MAFENIDNGKLDKEVEVHDMNASEKVYDPDKRVDFSDNQLQTDINSFDPDQRLNVVDDSVENSSANDSGTTNDNNSGHEIESSENNESKTYQEPKMAEQYKDDNGNIYRDANSLLPNNEYVKNGYTYETDQQGRITSAEGKLQVKDHDGRSDMPDNMDKVGKGDQKKNDQRSHLIGDQFNGSGDIANLVPMDGELNQGDYAKLENKLADAVKAGDDVRFKVEPVYADDSHRPSEFKVSYSINGEKDTVVFKNGGDSK